MKIVTTAVAALLIGSFTAVSANESIDAQIAKIQQAKAQERVQLMNEFKMQLADMNEQDRADAINQLRERTQARTEEGMAEAEGEQFQTRTRTQTRTQERINETDQMNQMQNMNQMQQMNQKQMGNMGKMMDKTHSQGGRIDMPSSAR